jgi:hypothetical protein
MWLDEKSSRIADLNLPRAPAREQAVPETGLDFAPSTLKSTLAGRASSSTCGHPRPSDRMSPSAARP